MLPLSCFGGWYFVLCLSLEKTASEKLTNSNSLGIFFKVTNPTLRLCFLFSSYLTPSLAQSRICNRK